MGTLSQRDLEDYLKEKEYQDLLVIKGNGENGHAHDDQDEEDGPTPEEAVSDADWLRETGFEFLIKAFDDNESGEEEDPLKGVISTLTLAQAEAVLKRVDHVRAATIQKRKISKRLPDVRDVFPSIKEDTYQSDGCATEPISCGSLSKSTSNNVDGDIGEYYFEDVPCSLPFDQLSSEGLSNIQTDPNGPDLKQKVGQLRQSSVDEVRTVFRSQSYENKADPRHKKGNWLEKNPFLRAAHKQGYKLGHTPPGSSQVPGTGVKVLSYNIRSSMKHLKPNVINEKKSVSDLFAPTVEIDEEINFYDKNEDNYGFQFVEGTDLEIKDNVLPDVEMTENPLGVTYPCDLGTEDQKKMHTLALIELAALLDQHGLTYSRRKAAKRKLKDGGVYGVALTTLVEEDRQRFPRCQTPIIFQRLLEEMERRTLKEEGILRKTASMQSAESLKELVDSSYRTCPDVVEEAIAQASPHDLSFLAKSFIRELPEPLLTNAYLDAFLQVTEIPCIVEQLKALNLLVMLLSEVHRETLKRLLEFLERVSEMEQYNRMNAQNLSVIMAPNLFPPARSGRTGLGQEVNKKDISQEMALATRTATVTKMLLKYKQVLWMVPLPLLKQIREQNEELSKTRLGKEHKGLKLLNRKPKEDYSKPRSNSDSSGSERSTSICSTSPLLESTNGKSIAVQLECDRRRVFTVILQGSMTVGTLLDKTLELAGGCGREKVNGRIRASSLENYYYASIPSVTNDLIPSLNTQCGHALYEVGGNIGQRKLDPNARISVLYKNNPDAEWMVKCGF